MFYNGLIIWVIASGVIMRNIRSKVPFTVNVNSSSFELDLHRFCPLNIEGVASSVFYENISNMHEFFVASYFKQFFPVFIP